jgi:hypothetical protein
VKNPPLLTAEEQAHVRAALHFLHARIGSWAMLAKILRSKRMNIRKIRRGQRINGMRGLARRISAVVGVPVGDLLTGRFLPTGMCPKCGYCAD